jgi:hypothetical protein
LLRRNVGGCKEQRCRDGGNASDFSVHALESARGGVAALCVSVGTGLREGLRWAVGDFLNRVSANGGGLGFRTAGSFLATLR